MKIRSGHIAFASVAIIAAFVSFAAWRANYQNKSLDALLSTEQSASTLAPSINAEHTEVDMGVIGNNAPTETKLRLFNVGKAPLRLRNIMSTCACTQGIIPPGQGSILPGGEGFITIKVFPEKIPGFHSHKTITIMSNDPKTPALDVSVSVKIDPEFDLSPSEADFGNVPKGQTPEIVLRLKSLTEAPVEITRVAQFTGDSKEKNPELFAFSFEKRPENEWTASGKPEYSIKVTLTPCFSPGPFEQRFVISTNIKRMPGMLCVVKGNIIAPYKVEPGYPKPLVLLKDSVKDLPGVVAGTLTIASEQPVEVTDIQFSGTKLSAAFRKSGDPLKNFIDISVKPDAPKGIFQEEMIFIVKSGDTVFQEKNIVRGMLQ
ncbi:MAG TPA: DUF1573 domain-containing protein [Candidatus Hydrogenedentes bacterium]|nr:DUF1573 domain-containing protein [Candidatus Hydrogenedentota bacterium]